MKLKNKKTGEIGYPYFQNWKEITCVIVDENAIQIAEYSSLAELNEEWEDYEEPKTFWYMTAWGDVKEYSQDQFAIKQKQQIGNYFETKEEAEKAVEKLKAWKRLKDKGFRFTGINDDEDSQELITQCGILCEADIYHLAKDEDFLLLFGGEE